jgi:dihydroorotate dehydrogenase (NAD+) catalytic subunit
VSTVDLTTTLAGMTLRNPVTTASGTFASGREYADFMDLSALGAVTTKGVSLEPWAGGPSPRIAETASGMLNAIGLQNPGVEAFAAGDLAWLAGQDVPVIVNVAGHHVTEYAEVIERFEAAEHSRAIHAWELNVSCPNVDEGGMAFGVDRAAAADATRRAREVTRKPLFVKLSPNVTDVVSIAAAVAEAGADGVSLVNTLLGMSIDAETRRPRLARVVGGLSGPAIKPVALRMVWQVHRALPELPIVGMGGIMTGEDAVEFMLAGATAVAVGTASFVDPTSAVRVVDGIREYCVRHGIVRVSELVGALGETP